MFFAEKMNHFNFFYFPLEGLRLLCSEFDFNEDKMKLTSLKTSGNFNVQSIINASLDLQNKGSQADGH